MIYISLKTNELGTYKAQYHCKQLTINIHYIQKSQRK